MKLHDAMKELLGQFGSTLPQEERLLPLLADYRAFDDYPAMKLVMKTLSEHGYLRELYGRIQEGGRPDIRTYGDYLRNSLRISRNFSAEFADYAVDSIFFAMGLTDSVSEPADHGFDPAATSEKDTQSSETGSSTGRKGKENRRHSASETRSDGQDDADSLMELGHQAFDRGDYDEASQLFRKAAELGQQTVREAMGWYGKASTQKNLETLKHSDFLGNLFSW